jgi:ankyrin repeat protein
LLFYVVQYGYTPLHQAAQQGQTQVINVLLQHQAQPNELNQVCRNVAILGSIIGRDRLAVRAVSALSVV